jgi:hypothetical protein
MQRNYNMQKKSHDVSYLGILLLVRQLESLKVITQSTLCYLGSRYPFVI